MSVTAPDAVPLTSKQKFKLAGRTVMDPFTFVFVGGFVGGAAGVERAQNHFRGYGQGAQGYAKRFGAGYADAVAGTFIGSAILPSLLKQDPRYFYKGTGNKRIPCAEGLQLRVTPRDKATWLATLWA
jgi:hypothetical protein